MTNIRYILALWYLAVITSCVHPIPEEIAESYNTLPDKVDFNFDVKPILSDKCFACHGPDQKSLKADLRLDLPGDALLRKESGDIPIISGNSARSPLIKRILSMDEEFQMPPVESHLTLNDREKAILIKWIDEGAEYRPHWSFIKPKKSEPPQVENIGWPQNQIDHFVLSKLEAHGMVPSSKATKELLVRRAYFNLTGLPPTLDEIEDFVNNQSPEAYERMIDQLLDSKSYGERMAMEWMDVARYADSDGYLDDKHRNFSPWRDWVIRAFNQNMSYEDFASWQLAGDLIPEPSPASILATAFNRLHRKNSEAGIVFEEYRTEYVADRTNTLGKAFLGLSLECARCHDHKYDPISQEDYYKVFAFFNSTNELGTAIYGPDQTPGPSLLLTTEERRKILEYTTSKIEKQEEQLAKLSSNKGYKDKEKIASTLESNKSKGLVAYFPFDGLETQSQKGIYTSANRSGPKPAVVKEPEIKPGASGTGVFLNDYTQVKLPEKLGWFERTDPFSVTLSVYPDTLYAETGIFYHCEDFRLGLKGYSLYLEDNHLRFVMAHSWPQNAIQLKTKEPLIAKEWTQVTITYDGSSKAKGISIFLNGEQVPVTIDFDHLYKGILFEPDIHTYGFNGFTLGNRDKMKTFKHGGIDELKIYNRELSALEAFYSFDEEKALKFIKNWDVEADNPIVQQYYDHHFNNSVFDARRALHAERVLLNDQINQIPEIMVMGDLPVPRPTFVLERGLYSAPGERVDAGTPDDIFVFDNGLPSNRLGLTKWLFDKDNPLTARVFVNRIWQMHFGKGIVKTSDNFGNQGGIPTHPELLDWLAVEFMESGWDIKQLHKTIVMSSTFQQSSRSTARLRDIDPGNDLLSRGPSYRLKAEMIRDNALAISGLLVDQQGGNSVYPYQPAGLWDEISNKKWRYPYLQQPGEGLYRRSLYTVWKRTSPPPSMLVFDVPDRSVCRVVRANTSTPLQALVLLNDPQYVEAARVLAEKIIAEEDSLLTQLYNAFSLCTGRFPDQKEVELLSSFYKEEFERFSKEGRKAELYLTTGEKEPNNALEPIKVAALATVINGVLNTNESYTLR